MHNVVLPGLQRKYDLIVVGSGSAMNIVGPMIEKNPKIKIAVIDKDEPGGICLTRGCIPSKILLYPAELVRTIEQAGELGVKAEITKVDFPFIMERMRQLIGKDIESIRRALSNSENFDYYHAQAEFVSPYTLKINDDTITSKMIFLCTGSEVTIPPIKGLEEVGYLTSDTMLALTEPPASIAIVGGGYIAAEYGHFFSAMGTKVTVVGRNPRFLPDEEPEISELAKRELGKHMTILTGLEVMEAKRAGDKKKKLIAQSKETGERKEVESEEIMIASGRGPTTHLLHPERAGIKMNDRGWLVVNDYLETSQPNIWAFGDALGKYMFKHVANYESQIVFYNAVLGQKVKPDYHAIPHAVFTEPEVAAVGLGEKQAIEEYGRDKLLIGFHKFEDTAKGEAMNAHDFFVKVILERETMKILGAHIIGPEASILIQEIINVMYTQGQSAWVVDEAIHIHPSLSEVVQRAFQSPMTLDEYHHMLGHMK